MGCASSRSNPKCFLDLEIGGEAAGRLVIQLRSDVVPRTADNFRGLCTGEHGRSYKGSTIHRIVTDYVAQGGECGKSVYGKKFEDENFKLPHRGKGILSMANSGPDTNGSQFFISLGSCKDLDGKHVVFGKVIQGKEILELLNECGSKEGRTRKTVKISDCGQLS